MPCFLREKTLSTRPRGKKNNENDFSGPKPVRPRAIRYHGLFSLDIAKLHLIVDDRWTPDSLTDQFAGLTALLSRRVVYSRHESINNRRNLKEQSKILKKQCCDGRLKLQNVNHGNNSLQMRNYLIKHRDMQRLYHKMPIHLVVDNINQRTFVLRKERDRLECLLGQRKREYKELLVSCATIENHIKFENEFVLQDELKSRVLLKKIENSDVRLKAIKTINNTYQKMVQVLLQDQIFYEPILRSLDDDMEDQANMIKHILYLGMPVISKFKELSQKYIYLEKKSRQRHVSKMQRFKEPQHYQKDVIPPSANPKHYLRTTRSMNVLKIILNSLERTIKELKIVTHCSQAKEIYPSAKAIIDKNRKCGRRSHFREMTNRMLTTKMECTNVYKDLLINNVTEEEINRLERIKDLKAILEEHQQIEDNTIKYLKNRADAIIMFRVTLWNLLDVLRHIKGIQKFFRSAYPNSYLKLPLLKFEMLHMRSAPPDLYEEDITKLMQYLKKKVYNLIKGYKSISMKRESNIIVNNDKYHAAFLDTRHDPEIEVEEKHDDAPKEDLLAERKNDAIIPSRKQIKVQSARILDEFARKFELGEIF